MIILQTSYYTSPEYVVSDSFSINKNPSGIVPIEPASTRIILSLEHDLLLLPTVSF